MAALAEFLVMTSLPQLLGSGLSMKSDADNEYNRQLAICNQITKQKARTQTLIDLTTEVGKAEAVVEKIQGQLDDMRDDIQAEMNQIAYLKQKFKTKLLVFIVINIISVAIMAIFLSL